MKNPSNYFKAGKLILLIVAMVLVGQTLFAQKQNQAKEDEKIQIKIIKEKDGKKGVFEKKYKNQEEMDKDKSLQTYSQDILITPPPFADPPNPEDYLVYLDTIIKDELRNEVSNTIVRPPFPPGVPAPPLVKKTVVRIEKFHPDSMKIVMPFNEEIFHRFQEDNVVNEQIKILPFKGSSEMTRDVKIFVTKKLSIKDIDGKKSDLKFDHLDYFPNPSKGAFHLHFRTSKENPVTVKILNEKSEVIFLDKVEAGLYDKQIDLTDKKKGTYILEIKQKNKKTQKRIIVE